LFGGCVLHWFRLFPVSWREGATATHDFLAFALVVVIAVHVVMALAHRDELLSMFKGMVTVEWARRHTPERLEEESRAP
jgi:cytochrome b subunit of formate dehydrogenase